MRRHTQVIIFLLTLVTALSIGCNQQKSDNAEAPASGAAAGQPVGRPQASTADSSVLAGIWVRTDAPYQMKIDEVLENGRLKAGYYNPKSIHVSRAEWAHSAEGITVYLEMRDENYPGSNYSLTYIPERDVLAGVYFQAVERVTYDVEFARVH